MLSLQQLQRQLEDAYSVDFAEKFTESNVVDIILHLVATSQLDAIWSPDGREIVTQRHLEQQLRAAIASHGGRLAILDLPDLLNVELRHIERIVYDSSKKSSYTLHQGDLITAAYLDRICVEINDVLSDRGSVSLFELAKRFDLDTAFLVQVITPKIGNVIKGSVDRADGILYTEQFLTTQRAKLQFTTIQEHARGLIATGEVQGELSSGSLRASKRDTTPTFIPTIYKTARSEWIRNFFRMNGYIDKGAVEQTGLDMKSAVQLLQEASLPVIQFEAVLLGSQVKEAVEDALNTPFGPSINPVVVDVAAILPENIRDLVDISKLLEHLDTPAQGFVIVSNAYAISADASQRCHQVIAQTTEESLIPSRLKTVCGKLNERIFSLLIAHVKEEAKNYPRSGKSPPLEAPKPTAELIEKVDTMYLNIQYFNHSTTIFENGNSREQLAAYLCQTLCRDLLIEVIAHLIQTQRPALASVAKLNKMSIQEIEELLGTIVWTQPVVGVVVVSCLRGIRDGLSAEDFMLTFEQDLSSLCGFTLRTLNDKISRVLLKIHSSGSHKQLETEADSSVAYRLLLALFCAACYSTVPYASARLMPSVLSLCKSSSASFAKDHIEELLSIHSDLEVPEPPATVLERIRVLGAEAFTAITSSLTKKLSKSRNSLKTSGGFNGN